MAQTSAADVDNAAHAAAQDAAHAAVVASLGPRDSSVPASAARAVATTAKDSAEAAEVNQHAAGGATSLAPSSERAAAGGSRPKPAPGQQVELDPELWTEVTTLDPSILLDLRYASTNNFVGEQMYSCGRCYLRPRAAEALVRVQDSLRPLGLGLKLYDCYRPLDVQWRLWRKVPDRRYVADPRKGSQHNRGLAVDLTLVELATGRELDMGTSYDFFGHEAWHAHTPQFAEPIRSNRDKLRRIMRELGWRETSSEWWHYSLPMPRGSAPIAEREWTCE